MFGAKVRPVHNVRIQQADQSLEVTSTRRPKERVDHLTLTPEIRLRSRNLGAFDSAPCPAGELPSIFRRPTNQGSDVLERQLKHVV